MDQIIRFCSTMLVAVVFVTAAAAAAAAAAETTTSVRTSTSTRVSSSKVISATENETETTSQSNPPKSLIYYQTKQSTTPTPTKLTLKTENEIETTSQSNLPKSQTKKWVHVPGNCPLGMVWREGNQVIMLATLMKGTGAAFARTSCLSRGARPLFLNTQQDADLLHRILRDCDKSDRLGGVWVPVRRNQQLKKVTYSQKAAWMTNSISANTWEFDWLNAKFDWYTGNVMLHPFPKDVTLEGIICIKN